MGTYNWRCCWEWEFILHYFITWITIHALLTKVMMDHGFDLFMTKKNSFCSTAAEMEHMCRSEVVWVMHCSAWLDPWLYEWPTRSMTPSIKPFSAGQHNPPLFFFSCKHTYRNRREAEMRSGLRSWQRSMLFKGWIRTPQPRANHRMLHAGDNRPTKT